MKPTIFFAISFLRIDSQKEESLSSSAQDWLPALLEPVSRHRQQRARFARNIVSRPPSPGGTNHYRRSGDALPHAGPAADQPRRVADSKVAVRGAGQGTQTFST
jgi:hypothetical protein